MRSHEEGAHLPDAQVDFRVVDGLHSSAVNIPDAGLHCHAEFGNDIFSPSS